MKAVLDSCALVRELKLLTDQTHVKVSRQEVFWNHTTLRLSSILYLKKHNRLIIKFKGKHNGIISLKVEGQHLLVKDIHLAFRALPVTVWALPQYKVISSTIVNKYLLSVS